VRTYLDKVSLDSEEKKELEIQRKISERTLEIDDELCAFFIFWQKISGSVKLTTVKQIRKETVIDWCKRRLISKLYMDQCVKV
jgi:hypothetical protein